MKHLLVFLCIFLASCQKKETFVKAEHIPSKIDSLVTVKEVQDYIHAADTFYNFMTVVALRDITITPPAQDSVYKMFVRRYGVDKAFYKADFDSNGYTDLLAFMGFKSEPDKESFTRIDPIVVMNFENDSVAVKRFSNDSPDVIVPELVLRSAQQEISLHKQYTIRKDSGKFENDTITKELVFKYGNFVEHNLSPANHQIEKIQFALTPCNGACPVFEMAINQKDISYFIAEEFNFSRYVDDPYDDKNDIFLKEGVFKATIEPSDYKKLTSLLNYIDFVNLENHYSVSWTCEQTVYLIITYDGGKQKKIYDYGKNGTYGLRALYELMHEMRFNQDWEKAEEPKGILIDKRSFQH